jgi:hypothetical protein
MVATQANDHPSLPSYFVTLASVPPRIRSLPVLLNEVRSWEYPPERIILTLSPYYQRFKRKLTPQDIPRELRQAPDIEILWRPDLGSINKIYWAVEPGRSRPDFYITIDDDRVYPPNFARELITNANDIGARAAGFRARYFGVGRSYAQSVVLERRTKKSPDAASVARPADILTGTGGVLYGEEVFFDDFHTTFQEFSRVVPEVKYCDDLFISGYLAWKRIQRWWIPPSFPIKKRRVSRWRKFTNRLLGDRSLWAINREAPFNDKIIATWGERWR